jgi:hypothetical protein
MTDPAKKAAERIFKDCTTQAHFFDFPKAAQIITEAIAEDRNLAELEGEVKAYADENPPHRTAYLLINGVERCWHCAKPKGEHREGCFIAALERLRAYARHREDCASNHVDPHCPQCDKLLYRVHGEAELTWTCKALCHGENRPRFLAKDLPRKKCTCGLDDGKED